MVDIASFVGRVRGMVARPAETLAEHTQPVPPWRIVAREHTLPLLISSALVSTLLIWMFPPETAAGLPVAFGPALLLRVVLNTAINFGMVALLAAIVRMFTGVFGGRPDFDAAYALVALSLTPTFVAEALAPLGTLGVLAFLAGLVYGLGILYRNSPAVLGVPVENRGKHFLLTLVTMFLVSAAFAYALFGLLLALLGPMGGAPSP